MNSSLSKVLELIKKTKDRLVLLDENGKDAYVIMPIEEYERLSFLGSDFRNLTEDEFLDKINRDIAVWKSQQQSENEKQILDKEFNNEFSNISQNFDNEWFEEKDADLNQEPFYFEKV